MGVRADIGENQHLMRGEKRVLRFTVLQEDGAPVQGGIGGWDISWFVRQNSNDDSPVVITKAVGTGLVIADAQACLVDVTLDPDDTLELASGSYWHTLWRTDEENDAVLSYGSVLLQQPVAQPVVTP